MKGFPVNNDFRGPILISRSSHTASPARLSTCQPVEGWPPLCSGHSAGAARLGAFCAVLPPLHCLCGLPDRSTNLGRGCRLRVQSTHSGGVQQASRVVKKPVYWKPKGNLPLWGSVFLLQQPIGLGARLSVGFAEMMVDNYVNSGRSNRNCPAKQLALLFGRIFFEDGPTPSIFPKQLALLNSCKELLPVTRWFAPGTLAVSSLVSPLVCPLVSPLDSKLLLGDACRLRPCHGLSSNLSLARVCLLT